MPKSEKNPWDGYFSMSVVKLGKCRGWACEHCGRLRTGITNEVDGLRDKTYERYPEETTVSFHNCEGARQNGLDVFDMAKIENLRNYQLFKTEKLRIPKTGWDKTD